jgi:hypothetical protein
MFDATPVQVEVTFDEKNTNWQPQAEYNLMFLRMQQNYANDLLVRRGHVFLNDIFDLLDIKRTPEGAIGGWLFGVNGGLIDFGLFGGSVENPIEQLKEKGSVLLTFSIIPSMYTHI